MAGFDIYVASDPGFLNPTTATLGSLIVNPSFTLICINGQAITGANCTAGTANGPGVVELSTFESSGSNECGGVSPCSGMALSITYQAMSNVGTTSLYYPSAPSCGSATSVTGTNVCVLLTDNAGTNLPETIQGATVEVSRGSGFDYSLSNNGPVSVTQGNSGTVTITATLTSGTSPPVTLSCKAPLPTGVVCSFSSNPLNPTGSSVLTINTSGSTPPGSYVLMVAGSPLGDTTTATSIGLTVNAQIVGLVCITLSTTATSCPTSPPPIGPLTVGSTFSVGLFVQNSAPLGGWDIYVAADPAFLNPTSAALGTLITNPSLTSICINGVATSGSCTVNTANGRGVVEVTTTEGSGLSDCNNPPGPCSGMAFTITYNVVGSTPTTPIFYPSATGCGPSSVSGTEVCVLLADNFGNPLPENIQGASVTQTVDPTTTSVSCTPSSLVLGDSTSCTATVTDTSSTGSTNPSGSMTFTTDSPGSFSPSADCNLSTIGSNQAQCSTTFTPNQVGSGTDNIGAMYSGDTTHTTSTAPLFPVTVSFTASDIHVAASSASLSIPAGAMAADNLTVTGLGSFTGSVTLSNHSVLLGVTVIFSPNPVQISTVGGSAISTMTVLIDSSMAAGTNFVLTEVAASGSHSHSVNINVTVTGGGLPSLVGSKIQWAHKISLSKTGGTQSWTATVANPLSTRIRVVVRIVLRSSINPSLTFDVSCGVTCVNTSGGVNNTPGLTPVLVAGGTKSLSFNFNQPISSSLVNQSVSFTATLYWSTSTYYVPSSSKTGTFTVGP